MKLYFWDWNDSLEIQKIDMEMPWCNNDSAAKNDCYTNLQSAILNAKTDLRMRVSDLKDQISKLEEAEEKLYSLNLSTVTKVDYIAGVY